MLRAVTLALTLLGTSSSLAPAQAEPARACPRHGPGFVEVPGTSTCIRTGGRVTAEAGGSTRTVRREDVVGLGAGGRVSMDARTDTAYGPVRTFVRARVRSESEALQRR